MSQITEIRLVHRGCGGQVSAHHTDSETNGFYDVYELGCDKCGHVVQQLECEHETVNPN